MSRTVLTRRQGHLAILTLNRPHRANTFDDEQIDELNAAANALAEDATIRVVLITGAGRHFCGGADLRAKASTRVRQPLRDVSLEWLPQPTVAVINGACMGWGCELALTCDFRLMSAEANIGLPEIVFGGLPGGGGTARMPRLIGLAAARRLIMTGLPIDSTEALRIGLVDEICTPELLLPSAVSFATVLASRAPHAQRTAKKLLNQSLDLDLETAIQAERKAIDTMATPEEWRLARAEAAANSETYAGIFNKKEGIQ